MHISALKRALWDMKKVHSWICEIGLLNEKIELWRLFNDVLKGTVCGHIFASL